MLFPDDQTLFQANEIIFRTKFAKWWSGKFAQLGNEELERRLLRDIGPAWRIGTPRGSDDPAAWVTRHIFDTYLGPYGGVIGAALALKDSPAEQTLVQDSMRRWFGVVYTGRLTLLIGSINQHTPNGGSLNKAIFIMREIDGENEEVKTLTQRYNHPGIYESSLKKSWRTFKPVAHLCAAYVSTELRYRGAKRFGDIFRVFATYCEHPALLEQFTAFSMYCTFGRFVEQFVTSFRPHGQQASLISPEEIYSLDRNFGFKSVFKLSFPPLSDDEIEALSRYRAPKLMT